MPLLIGQIGYSLSISTSDGDVGRADALSQGSDGLISGGIFLKDTGAETLGGCAPVPFTPLPLAATWGLPRPTVLARVLSGDSA